LRFTQLSTEIFTKLLPPFLKSSLDFGWNLIASSGQIYNLSLKRGDDLICCPLSNSLEASKVFESRSSIAFAIFGIGKTEPSHSGWTDVPQVMNFSKNSFQAKVNTMTRV